MTPPLAPSPLPRYVQITLGSTDYTFPLAPSKGVLITPLPQRGQVLATVGTLDSASRLDAPWVMARIRGLGASRAIVGETEFPDERAWEMENIQYWGGAWSLGPLQQTATDMTGVHQTVGYAEAIGVLFYWANTNVSARETLAYWVGSTTTWTSCTATADWEAGAGAGNTGFPCAGMAEFKITNLSAVALRTIATENGAVRNQLIYSTNNTTWTLVNHVNVADTPAGNLTDACTGLIAILGTLYTLSYNSTTKVVTLRQSINGTTWTTSTGGDTLLSNVAPRALAAQFDYAGVLRPFVYLQEGAYYYTGTGFGLAVDYHGDLQSNNGLSPITWQVDDVPGGWNVSQQGKSILLQSWPEGSATDAKPMPRTIGPTEGTQGLPTIRDGTIQALAAARNLLFAAIGGASASTKVGIFVKHGDQGSQDWLGPIYASASASIQIRAMYFSTLDDGTPRLHAALDSGAAGDTDLIFFENVNRDPRTVTSYKHAASGILILPKNNRGLPDLNGIWLSVIITATGLSANNKVSAVYASANAAPLASNGSWGTTLGDITTSGGSVNFSATPAGTGQSAREMQLRLDLAGVSNASPYIEAMVVNVRKIVPRKYIRVFPIDMRPPVGTQGGISSQKKLTDIETIANATTYLSVTYGQQSAVVMYLLDDANYLAYLDLLFRAGTGGAQTEISELELKLRDM